ncbi:hypothetical protein Tco_0066652 [Tanacetum coccineum]
MQLDRITPFCSALNSPSKPESGTLGIKCDFCWHLTYCTALVALAVLRTATVTHSEAESSVSSVIAITDVYLSVGSVSHVLSAILLSQIPGNLMTDMREAKPSARHSESIANAVYISYKVMFEHLRKNLKECGP